MLRVHDLLRDVSRERKRTPCEHRKLIDEVKVYDPRPYLRVSTRTRGCARARISCGLRLRTYIDVVDVSSKRDVVRTIVSKEYCRHVVLRTTLRSLKIVHGVLSGYSFKHTGHSAEVSDAAHIESEYDPFLTLRSVRVRGPSVNPPLCSGW